MNDQELLAIADGISERLWRVALDHHDPGGDRFVAVSRPYRGATDEDYGEWAVQILLVGGRNTAYCTITFGVCADRGVRVYHPNSGHHVVGEWAVSVFVALDDATDGMLARGMAREDLVSRATAARIVSAQRARSEAA